MFRMVKLDVVIASFMLVAVIFCNTVFGATVKWWNANYRYRQQLTVYADTSGLTAGQVVKTTVNTGVLESAGKVKSDKKDLRIVYWTGSSWTETGRDWVDSTTTWFKLAKNIGVSQSDNNYYMYYGNSNETSSPTGTVSLQYVAGKIGSGLQFPAASDSLSDIIKIDRGTQVNGNNYFNLNSNQGTVALWFKPTWNGNDSKKHIMFLADDGTTSIILSKEANNTLLFIYRAGGTTIGPAISVNSSNFSANTWHHIAGTWKRGGTVTLYLDGTNVASSAGAGTPTTVPSSIYIGSDSNGQYSVQGIVDEFVALGRITNDTEISSVYSGGQFQFEGTMKIYLQMEGSGYVSGGTVSGFGYTAGALVKSSSEVTGGRNQVVTDQDMEDSGLATYGDYAGVPETREKVTGANAFLDTQSLHINTTGSNGYGKVGLPGSTFSTGDTFLFGLWYKTVSGAAGNKFALAQVIFEVDLNLTAASWTYTEKCYKIRAPRLVANGVTFYNLSYGGGEWYVDNILGIRNLVDNGSMVTVDLADFTSSGAQRYYGGASTTNFAAGNTVPATVKSSLIQSYEAGLTYSNESSVARATTTTNTAYCYQLLEYNLSNLYSDQVFMFHSSGLSTAGGTSLTMGWDAYMWNNNTSQWVSQGTSTATYGTFAGYDTVTTTVVEATKYIDGSNKVYILVKSKGTSDGTNQLLLDSDTAFLGVLGTIPIGWTKTGTPTSVTAQQNGRDSDVAASYDGESAIELSNSSSSGNAVYQTVNVTSGNFYLFAGWIKKNSGTGSVAIELSGADSDNLSTTSSSWTRVAKVFKASSNSLTIKLYNTSTGVTGMFDDISLISIDGVSALIQNAQISTARVIAGEEVKVIVGSGDIDPDEGGEIIAEDNPLTKVIIPKNSLKEKLRIKIKRSTLIPTGDSSPSQAVLAYEITSEDPGSGQSKSDLRGVITVQLAAGITGNTINVEPLTSVSEAQKLMLGFWNGIRWVPITSDVEVLSEDVTVKGKTSHLTIFGMIKKEDRNVGLSVAPNPFTPLSSDPRFQKVTFTFANTNGEDVELMIWDITARLVSKQVFYGGVSTVSWDGRNEYGEVCEGGVYIYQLKVGNFLAGRGTIVLAK